MLFIIIPLILLGIVFLYAWIWEGEPAFGLLLGILVGILGALILLLISLSFASPSHMEIGQIDSYEIHALVDNASYEGYISGNVFLISSHIDEELEYRYMYNVEGKGYAFGSIDADECYLNTTKDTPTLEVRHWKYKNDFLQWAFGDPDINPDYIFFLPEGAEIINEFAIDFE
jgi:hypothetical protein